MKIHVDIDAQKQLGQTPLHYASKWGFADIVETLLEHSATVNVANRVGATPMKYAYNVKIGKMLKDAYVEQQKRRKSPQSSPIKTGEFVLISDEDLLDDETFVEYRNIEEMKRIDKAATAIAAHDTKLACFYMGLEVFPPNVLPQRLHIREGMPSSMYLSAMSEQFGGYTALHVAAIHGNLDMINVLLNHYVNVAAGAKSGATALHFACRERRLNVIKVLLSRCYSGLDACRL